MYSSSALDGKPRVVLHLGSTLFVLEDDLQQPSGGLRFEALELWLSVQVSWTGLLVCRDVLAIGSPCFRQAGGDV